MRILNIFYFLPFFIQIIWAECSDLNYADCIYWSEFCEWDDDTQECFEIGGGGDFVYGPYNFEFISEDNGLRDGPDYQEGILYYPIDANFLLGSIIFTPGFGGGSSTMSSWAQFFASHGFLSMTVGPNDEINDSHQQRGEGLLDGIESLNRKIYVVVPLYMG